MTNFTRREFIKGLGIAGGLSLLGTPAEAQIKNFIFKRKCKDAGAIIRKNFKNLTAAELAAFKTGVSVMKSRGPLDPTSWTYQAAIHGSSATPAQVAWSTCQHNTTFFLLWHRMYLCFFERILRKASGMPTLGLPYWNYSDASDPNARFLPAAFRDTTSPLFTPNRNANINAGTAQLAASAVSLSSVLPGPLGFYPFSGNINGTPHGSVHIGIGGGMGGFNTAGLDPIFWLHHCNIDRLWNRWLAGGGRSNPPATDTAWHNTNFTFFDEFGVQVQMKGSDLVNVNCFCRSCYDEEAEFVVWDILDASIKIRDILIGVYRKPIVLDTKRLRFVVDLNNKAKDLLTRLQAAKPNDELNFKLNFVGAKADKPVEYFYEVYLNLPENMTTENYRMESYAGNLSFFGVAQQHSMKHNEKEEPKFSVNVTDALKRLKNIGGEKTLSVTLVPTGLVSKNEKRLPIQSDAKVSVDQITLSVQERER